jgi:orotate phosphoribosyltransferase
VLIALDRKERAGPDGALSERSAAQDVAHTHGIPVFAIADLDDLFAFLDSESALARQAAPYRAAMAAYRERYGA